MFREDKVLIKRDVYELSDGEAIHTDKEIIAEDIPCHLSVNLNNTQYINKIPYIISTFTIYLDIYTTFEIRKNDFLTVTTKQGEIYELVAGEVKIYNLSMQVKCMLKEIIES